jgi:hypothetical protein
VRMLSRTPLAVMIRLFAESSTDGSGASGKCHWQAGQHHCHATLHLFYMQRATRTLSRMPLAVMIKLLSMLACASMLVALCARHIKSAALESYSSSIKLLVNQLISRALPVTLWLSCVCAGVCCPSRAVAQQDGQTANSQGLHGCQAELSGRLILLER